MEPDEVIRNKLKDKISNVIDPLDPSKHPNGQLLNIVTGRITPEKVNVDQAVELGTKQMKEFEESLPGGFRNSISKTLLPWHQPGENQTK